MRKRFTKKLSIIMLVLFVLLQGFSFASAETVGGIVMIVPLTARENDVFEAVLKAKDISDLYSFQAYIKFEADKVQVVDVKGLGCFADEFANIDYRIDTNSINIVGTMTGEFSSSHEEIAVVYFKALQGSGKAEFILDGKTCWAKHDADITGNLYIANNEVKVITSFTLAGGGSPEDGKDKDSNETNIPYDIDKIFEKISNSIEQSIHSAIEQLDSVLDLGDNLTKSQKEKAAQLTQKVTEKLLYLNFIENGIESNVVDLGLDEVINNIKEARRILEKAVEKGLIKHELQSVRLVMESAPVNIIMTGNFFKELQAADMSLSIELSQLNLIIPNNVFITEDNFTISLRINPKTEEVLYKGNSTYKPFEVYELEMLNEKDGQKVSFLNFKNDIELKIKAPGTNSWETMALYAFNETENSWDYLKQARWIKGEKAFSIKVKHFSKYALVEHTKDFSDTSGVYDEAKKAIKVLTTRHIIEGTDEKLYNPKAGLTRAEMAKLMVETAQLEADGYIGAFNDVTEGQWFTPYVEAAFKTGMVAGFGDGTFRPDELVTREQLAVAICNMYIQTTDDKSKSIDLFIDDHDISDWAREKVYLMRANGLVSGVGNNTFSPGENINRADTAVLFYNFLKKIFN